MPANWHGITGDLGRGAFGAAADAMRGRAVRATGQSVAPAAPLMTLWPECGISTVGRAYAKASGRRRDCRVASPVTFEPTFGADRAVAGMDCAA